MKKRRLGAAGSRTLTAVLLAVVVPPAVTLIWLGLRLLEQDRSLLAQRELEGRQASALAAARALEQSLTRLERGFSDAAVPDGVVRMRLSSSGVEVDPAHTVAWLPIHPARPEADPRLFDEAERSEYQGSAPRALAAYERLARSSQLSIQAGALLRLARIHRRQREWVAALDAYRRLAAIDDVAIEGAPADLIARRAICAVLAEADRQAEKIAEARSLETDFLSGRWRLDYATWELVANDIERWTGRRPPVGEHATMMSRAADALWTEWRQSSGEQAAQLPVSRRRVLTVENRSVTVVSVSSDERMIALAIPPHTLSSWAAQAIEGAPGRGHRLTLLTTSGQSVDGSLAPDPAPSSSTVRLPAPDTGLPWTLVVAGGASTDAAAEFAARRRLLFGGLAAILLLVGGGGYFLWRAVERELAIARLQTDFVATVSHEFRTPLTSLRHVTELLEEDDGMLPDRRRSFYEALRRNTERLHYLVESVLDFARMESGKKPYSLQTLDAGELAARVVDDFRKQIAPDGSPIHLEIETSGGVRLRADSASLTNALWNLLDNAVKYSPGGRAVHVSVLREASNVAISVRDDGLGVPRDERDDIFRRFVRGKTAMELGIKGTGLGLAMVSHIVAAHGGRVELESHEGAGSTFRMVLPHDGHP